MPADCVAWHSEDAHGQVYGHARNSRTISGQDYRCVIRGTMTGHPWTFVVCPSTTVDHYDGGCEFQCGGNRHIAHMDAIVIAVDGACRRNGGPRAESGIGVYFHRDSSWNRALAINTPYRHTSQRAELHAGIEALELAKEIRGRNPRGSVHPYDLPSPGPTRQLRRVVVMADSAYLVNAMTDWIFKWEQNGYTNARGLNVTNADLFRQLEGLVDDLNAANVDVQFWHVKREDNGVADCLANAALDGVDAERALDEYFR